MADLGSAYVNIVPKAEGISSKITGLLEPAAGPAGKKAGGTAGSSFMAGLKSVVTVAAVGKIIKDTFEAGANLEQSFGGLDTLYGDAAAGAKEYALAAAEAGISANEYAEQAVSFGAALKAAYGNDTTAAMEAANVAIMDMADNAAKMGTPLESIQQAYQGFARGQYQLLDNLKLGYGGTKTEMERLLAHAEELTGIKYDINNLGDVYSAIHEVQKELGLTGVAAFEAQTTLTGSFNALKASWTNVMAAMVTGVGLEEAMANLTNSVTNFASNVLRALGNVAPQVPTLIMGLLDAIISNAPNLIAGGIEMIAQLIVGFLQAIPGFIEKIPELFTRCLEAFFSLDWASIGRNIINGIIAGVTAAGSALYSSLRNLAYSALAAAKQALGIASPSKEFANQVGRWVPPGIAMGIEKNMSPLNTTIADVSHTMTADMARATLPGKVRPETNNTQNVRVQNHVEIEFNGSLAQLGRVLYPYIKAEEGRLGTALIK